MNHISRELAREAGFVIDVSREHWGDVNIAKLCHPTPSSVGLYRMLDNFSEKIVQQCADWIRSEYDHPDAESIAWVLEVRFGLHGDYA